MRWISLFCLSASSVFAIDHGPIVQWFQNPCHEAEIRWLDEKKSTSASYSLGYRLASKTSWTWVKSKSRPFGKSSSIVYAVSLSQLQADCRYEFVIRDDQDQSLNGPHLIQTAPANFRPLHFVIGGDMYHERKLLDDMNKRAGAEDPLFAALIGDLAYANNTATERWYHWVDSWVKHAKAQDGRLIPMVVGIGNHEVDGSGFHPEKNTPGAKGADLFYSLFRMPIVGGRPIAYYNIDFGNYLSLVLLDSGHTQRISEQVAFVKESASARRSVPFVFAAYHRPAWGSGAKDDAVDIQAKWCPWFENLGIDAVFEHDLHTYKRTWPLIAGKRDDANGIPYLGDGAWGVNVRELSPQTVADRKWLAKYGSINHLFRVTLRENEFHCEAKKANGEIFDEAVYSIRR